MSRQDMRLFQDREQFYTFIDDVIRFNVTADQYTAAADHERKTQSPLSCDYYFESGAVLRPLLDAAFRGDYDYDDQQPLAIELKFMRSSAAGKRTMEQIRSASYALDTNITLLLVSPDISYSEMSELRQQYRYILFWEANALNALVETYKFLYLRTLPVEKIRNNGWLSKVTAEDVYTYRHQLTDTLCGIVRVDKEHINPIALVLGAGVSCSEGAKSWKGLIQDFYSSVQHELNITGKQDNLLSKIGNTDLIAAQLDKELLNRRTYFEQLYLSLYGRYHEKLISDNLAETTARFISSRSKLRSFRVMTYNFDNFAEIHLDHMNISYNCIHSGDAMLNESVPIYHVHGYLPYQGKKYVPDPEYEESIKLTEDDYNDLYNNPYSWRIRTQLSFFDENICLFVGCSLTDPNIRRLLKMEKGSGVKHFAIIDKGRMSFQDQAIASNHFAHLGVNVIWTDDFEDTKNTLAALL